MNDQINKNYKNDFETDLLKMKEIFEKEKKTLIEYVSFLFIIK